MEVNAPVRYNCRGWLPVAMDLVTPSDLDSFRENVLKFDFELGVKAKTLPLG